jgi:hypothetical protein
MPHALLWDSSSSSPCSFPILSSVAHLVSNIELRHLISLLDDLSNKFVATDEVGWAFEMSSVEVQVAAAEGCGGDFQDSVGGLLNLWVWTVFYGDLILIVSTLFFDEGGQLCCLALKSLLSTTARIVSGGVKPMFAVGFFAGWVGSVGSFLSKDLLSSPV